MGQIGMTRCGVCVMCVGNASFHVTMGVTGVKKTVWALTGKRSSASVACTNCTRPAGPKQHRCAPCAFSTFIPSVPWYQRLMGRGTNSMDEGV
jgi:hypothetical protein